VASLADELDDLARSTAFSGVVRVDRADEVELATAYGLAERRWGIPNELGTRFSIASGTKGLTALAVISLIEGGELSLETTARSILGADLPLIADDVTVEHLLAHRSGIGDYLDEADGLDPRDLESTVPVQTLDSTEAYLPALDGYATLFPAGTDFAYSNAGFVVVALIAERVTGVRFEELVRTRVCEPAGMRETAFHRSDELPEGVATGYLDVEGFRTNVFRVPLLGGGDGGAFSTAADVRALWSAFFAGRIVPAGWVTEMTRPRSVDARGGSRYGLGFWLDPVGDAVSLEGSDVGVSFRSVHDPGSDRTIVVLSNTTEGAWPMAELLEARFG